MIGDAPRATETADTTSNRRSNGRYSLRCIPTKAITVSEIQKTDLGTDLWMPVTGDGVFPCVTQGNSGPGESIFLKFHERPHLRRWCLQFSPQVIYFQ